MFLVLLVMVGALTPAAALAQPTEGEGSTSGLANVAAYAAKLWAAKNEQSWVGPRVFIDPRSRPELPMVVDSVVLPIRLLADAGVEEGAQRRVLRALEFAMVAFDDLGWRRPMGDAGAGGSSDLDVYVLSLIHI